jgi:hypothetical protein
MASLLGKMPTTSVRRLISRFNRPDWVRRVQLGPGLGKGHVGEHVLLGAVHDCASFGTFGLIWSFGGRMIHWIIRASASPLRY